MTTQRLRAATMAAVFGLAVFNGGPPALVGHGTPVAVAQSSSADVMAAYGITQSTTLTQAQINTLITNIMSSNSGGTTGVANFVAALMVTVGVSKTGDTMAGSLSTMLASIAATTPALSGAITGGLTAASTSLKTAGYTAAAAVTLSASAKADAIAVQNNITIVVPVVPISPAQLCVGGSCT